jgi:hypothetical protein
VSHVPDEFPRAINVAELFPRTFCIVSRKFPIIQAARGCYRAATLIPDTVLPAHSGDRAVRFPGQSPPDARARVSRWWSAGGQLSVISGRVDCWARPTGHDPARRQLDQEEHGKTASALDRSRRRR